MTPKQRTVLQICLIILVISLVVMTVHSIISHGGIESSSIVPFLGILVVMVIIIRNNKGEKLK